MGMLMDAGRMRHRVSIQQVTETKDTYGATTRTWATIATVWAAIEPIAGREYFYAQQVQSNVSHRVTIRHRAGVTPKMRIMHDSRTFEIESVRNLGERDRWLELMCSEVTT